LTQAGCAADEACQYHGGPFARCGKPGAVGAGSPCSGEECEAGMQCYEGFCRRFCDTRAPQNNSDCSGYCAFVNTGNAGRCL
jgi:hypothetical protein